MTSKNLKRVCPCRGASYPRVGVKSPLMLNLQTKRMDCITSTILMLVLPQSETA